MLDESFRLALRAHATHWRKSALDTPTIPYVVHPVRVAGILASEWDLNDRHTLAVALLHGVLERSAADKRDQYAEEIERIGGPIVLQAVQTLTKPTLPKAVPSETKARRDAQYFRVVRASPYWLRMVKCADRVDNLRLALNCRDRLHWEEFSSETIGWHLFLARETAPIAEVALFKILVDGERQLNGRVPHWVNGHMVDPAAARMVPEHIARHYGIVGIACRSATLFVGSVRTLDAKLQTEIRSAINVRGHDLQSLEPLYISEEALRDALAASVFGQQ